MLPQWVITEKYCTICILYKWYEDGYSGSILKYATELSKHQMIEISNCTVTLSKYLEENQEIHFHHHSQACLIHYFIRTRCHYYCTWFNAESGSDTDIYKPGQTRLTRTERDPVDPDDLDDPTWFQPCFLCHCSYLVSEHVVNLFV